VGGPSRIARALQSPLRIDWWVPTEALLAEMREPVAEDVFIWSARPKRDPAAREEMAGSAASTAAHLARSAAPKFNSSLKFSLARAMLAFVRPDLFQPSAENKALSRIKPAGLRK